MWLVLFAMALVLAKPANTAILKVPIEPFPISSDYGFYARFHVGRSAKPTSFLLDTTRATTLQTCIGQGWRTAFTINATSGKTLVLRGIEVECGGRHSSINVAALAANKSALPHQLAKASSHLDNRVKPNFAYCLPAPNDTRGGSLFFGTTNFIPMKNIPMKITQYYGAMRYSVQLTQVRMGSSKMNVPRIMAAFGTGTRYTTLPDPAMSFLQEIFFSNARRKGISQVFVTSMDLCFNTTIEQVMTFPDVIMVFSRHYEWHIPPTSYLYPFNFPSIFPIFCLGIIDGGDSPATIGTMKQQNNLIQYDIAKGTVGISGPLPSGFCSALK